MQYPIFDTDGNGNIVIDHYVTVDDIESEDAAESIQYSENTVSDGNAGQDPEPVYTIDMQALDEINENLERIVQAQASSTGYLSSTIVDAFDRVVKGYNYDYYIAFRNGSDSYSGVMYLSDHFTQSGNSILLSDAQAVTFYRSYSGNTYYYYYQVSYPGDVQVNVSGNLMYYTNCISGYPVLGQEAAPGHYPGWFIPLAAVMIAVTLISLIRRKN